MVFRLLTCCFFSLACFTSPLLGEPYPETPQSLTVQDFHGYPIHDPYDWLEQEGDLQVRRWSEQQQFVTDSYLKDQSVKNILQKRYEELLLKNRDSVIFEGESGRKIIKRYKKQLDQTIYLFQSSKKSSVIEMINPNRWGKGYKVESLVPSPNGHYLFFSMSRYGDELPRGYILNLDTLCLMNEPLQGTKHSQVVWHPDGHGFFYTALNLSDKEPSSYYHSSIYFHTLRQVAKQDRLIYEDPYIKEWNWELVMEGELLKMRGDRVNPQGKYCEMELSFDPKNFDAPPALTMTNNSGYKLREKKIGGESFLISTVGAPNGQVYHIKKDEEGQIKSTLLIAESEGVIQDLQGIGGHLAVSYLTKAQTRIKIYSLRGKFLKEIPVPLLGFAKLKASWESREATVTFEALHQPRISYYYTTQANQLVPLNPRSKRLFNSAHFVTSQAWYTSHDGTAIPVFIAHRKGLAMDGKRPTLIFTYGGFGVPMLSKFYATLTPWLELGGVIAIPQLRGGGAFGESWHQQGIFEGKQSTIQDCVALAQWLIDEGYTNADHLAIYGRSNGGLIAAGAVNRAPELFKAAVIGEPLLDMLNYHKFKLGRTWVGEYGCADNPQHFSYLSCLSPYHTIQKRKRYPAMLFYTGKYDWRVDAMHVRKMVARLQNSDLDGGPFLMYNDAHSGHRSPSTKHYCASQARIHAFLLEQVTDCETLKRFMRRSIKQ